MFFGSWGPGEVEKVSPMGGTWDVCRPFSHHIGTHPELRQQALPNHYCQAFYEGQQVYFLLGDLKAPTAFHAREGSQALARHRGDNRHVLIENLDIFKWYRGAIERPTTDPGYK